MHHDTTQQKVFTMNENIRNSIDFILNNWNGEYLNCNGAKIYPYPAECEFPNNEFKYLISAYGAYFIDLSGNIYGSKLPIELKEVPMKKHVYSFTIQLPKVNHY